MSNDAEQVVSEREARRRERAAFMRGWRVGEGYFAEVHDTALLSYMERSAADRYPIRKKVPRIVRGWSVVDGVLRYPNPPFLPHMLDREDVRLLADLLDNPHEEVDE